MYAGSPLCVCVWTGSDGFEIRTGQDGRHQHFSCSHKSDEKREEERNWRLIDFTFSNNQEQNHGFILPLGSPSREWGLTKTPSLIQECHRREKLRGVCEYCLMSFSQLNWQRLCVHVVDLGVIVSISRSNTVPLS